MTHAADEDAGEVTNAPLWVWGIACLGLVFVLGSIVFVVREAVEGSSPPDVTVHAGTILPIRNGFLVEFLAINEGGSTAEGLTVEGYLRRENEKVETSTTTVDYVPAHSRREGGLFFTADPRQHELRLRATGYEKP